MGADGILIRGPSGAGKSRLAHLLLTDTSRNARLVADDRVHLASRHGRIVARAPEGLRGLIELRGYSIVRVQHEPAAVVRLVVDLLPGRMAQRLLEEEEFHTHLCGVTLPRLPASGPGEAIERLAAIHPGAVEPAAHPNALPLAFALQHGNYSRSFAGVGVPEDLRRAPRM
jgi:serine kinase of HPr protein (carbohydrate metabolism regulator)